MGMHVNTITEVEPVNTLEVFTEWRTPVSWHINQKKKNLCQYWETGQKSCNRISGVNIALIGCVRFHQTTETFHGAEPSRPIGQSRAVIISAALSTKPMWWAVWLRSNLFLTSPCQRQPAVLTSLWAARGSEGSRETESGVRSTASHSREQRTEGELKRRGWGADMECLWQVS